MRLWSYWRSSCSYRVRIALNYKGLSYETVPVHLVNDGGEQFHPEYERLNPQCLVPALRASAHEPLLTQSLAIIEYLDERWPQPPLLPREALSRARVRSLSQLIASEVQPLQNLRVLSHLKSEHHFDPQRTIEWTKHWMMRGFDALERQLVDGDRYCVGDEISMADLALIPQLYNARRFKLDLARHPKTLGVEERCLRLPAFADAQPERQPDAPGAEAVPDRSRVSDHQIAAPHAWMR
jgi:maleylacetoacetate isomerase